MGSLLDAFARANIIDEMIHPGSKEYQEAEQDVINSQKRMREILDEKGLELMEEYDEDNRQRLFYYGSDHFQYGFRLGVLLMAEVFSEKEQMVEAAGSL